MCANFVCRLHLGSSESAYATLVELTGRMESCACIVMAKYQGGGGGGGMTSSQREPSRSRYPKTPASRELTCCITPLVTLNMFSTLRRLSSGLVPSKRVTII